MLFFDSRIEFEVIESVDMFSSTGITPRVPIGQTRIRIRLGRNIDAAQHESESVDPPKRMKMIEAAESDGQQEAIMC